MKPEIFLIKLYTAVSITAGVIIFSCGNSVKRSQGRIRCNDYQSWQRCWQR